MPGSVLEFFYLFPLSEISSTLQFYLL